jgi:hypothetical protein
MQRYKLRKRMLQQQRSKMASDETSAADVAAISLIGVETVPLVQLYFAIKHAKEKDNNGEVLFTL